jgi:hypothetical protein
MAMADDQQPREDAGDSGDRPGEPGGVRPPSSDRPGPDETREFDPFAEADQVGAGDAGTHEGGAGGAGAADETVTFPAGDETAEVPYPDRTTRPPIGDETAVISPARAGWSGRAEVRPREAGGGPREAAPSGWDERDFQDGRRWWMPIVVALVALLLLGVLGLGIWLAARSDRDGEPVAPATTASATPATTAPATSAPPTTPAAPTASPTTAVVTEVVPPLTGLDEETARDILRVLGLEARVETRESSAVPEGRIIESKPPVGTTVPRGTEIVLIIATAPPPTTEPAPVSPSTAQTR